MPILLPIEDESAGAPPPLATSAGASALEGALTVANRVRGASAGASLVSGALRLGAAGALAMSGAVSGVSATAARLRLNAEVNVNLAGTSAGTSASEGMMHARLSGLTARSDSSSSAVGALVVARADEFGFTVFVDVLSSALADALERNIHRYTARLIVGRERDEDGNIVVAGQSVPVIRAEISAPPDRLGTELSVVLARPDVATIAYGDVVDFEVGVWTGEEFAYVTLLEAARLSGRGARYANERGLPADSVEMSFVDVMGDRWNRAPSRNLIFYDPDETEKPAPSSLSSQAIVDERGQSVEPEVRAVSDLSLLTLLDAAYVEGCGFSRVVTNCEDFPVSQATFTVTGGYDAGVRQFLSLYDVTVFVAGNDLWIVDTGAVLPAGLSPREFPARLSVAVDDTLPKREPVTAILVRLKDDRGAGEYFTERLETPQPSETGTFGQEGYTRTSVERRVREYRTFSAPESIVREETVSEKTTTEDFEFNVINRETRTDSFDALGRHTGYTRTVEQRLPDPASNGEMLLQTALEEWQFISYTPDPRDPARDLQDRVETRTEGLILVDEDKPYLDKPYRLPLSDAHRSGYVDPDANQRTEFGPIKTEIIELKVRGQQVTRERRVFNHVTDAPDSSSVQTLTASNSIERKSATTRSVLVMAEGGTLAGRRVPEFDGTGLPGALALKLARRRLAQLNDPQREVSVQMAYLDIGMRRGADLRLRGRGGVIGDLIVRGYSIVFSTGGGSSDFTATMSIQAKELRQ